MSRTVAELREAVAAMRELGVTRWGDIELGAPPPAPAKALSPEELAEAVRRNAEAIERHRHETLFAAVPIRPRFEDMRRKPEDDDAA